jgi:hypothetical protein
MRALRSLRLKDAQTVHSLQRRATGCSYSGTHEKSHGSRLPKVVGTDVHTICYVDRSRRRQSEMRLPRFATRRLRVLDTMSFRDQCVLPFGTVSPDARTTCDAADVSPLRAP